MSFRIKSSHSSLSAPPRVQEAQRQVDEHPDPNNPATMSAVSVLLEYQKVQDNKPSTGTTAGVAIRNSSTARVDHM